MTPERWRRVGEVFDRLIELPPHEQHTCLLRGRARDEALRREVERMLGAHYVSGVLDARGAGPHRSAAGATTARRARRLGRSVPGAARDRPRRHGRRLRGARSAAGSPRCPEVPAARAAGEPSREGAVPRGGARRGGSRSREHLHRLRHRPTTPAADCSSRWRSTTARLCTAGSPADGCRWRRRGGRDAGGQRARERTPGRRGASRHQAVERHVDRPERSEDPRLRDRAARRGSG